MSETYTISDNPAYGSVPSTQTSISVPSDGELFLIPSGEGAFKLAQRQGNTIVQYSLGGEPAMGWDGRTIGQWQGNLTADLLKQLGYNDSLPYWDGSKYTYHEGETNTIPMVGADFDTWVKNAGIQVQNTPINITGGDYSRGTLTFSPEFQQAVQGVQSYATKNTYQPGSTQTPGSGGYVDPTGGYTGPDATTTQPLYDPNTGQWTLNGQPTTVPGQTPTIAPNQAPGSPTGTQTTPQTGQFDATYATNALELVYTQRPDLQELFYPPSQGGGLKNPNDPRVAGIGSLFDWADQYGVNEEPLLQNIVSQAQGTGGAAAGTAGTAGATGASGTSSTGTTGGAAALGLTGEFAGLYNQLENYLNELTKRGQVLNPNVQITPEKLAEFTKIAEGEINPYYSSQLKLARESLLSSLGYNKEQLLKNEQNLERTYGRSLTTLGENAADQGFAQSGLRKRDEANLAYDTQNQIDTQRRELAYGAGNAARTFAQAWGTSELPSTDLSTAPTVLPGQSKFSTSGTSRSLYELSPDTYQGLVGEQEFARRSAIDTRTSDLESAYRTNQALDQQRTLIL